MAGTPNAQIRATSLQAPLARLLRPLVRLLVRHGVGFPVLSELLRELYVNVAEHDFALPSKEQTDSRVSLLTGINRKEVRRLRDAGAPVNLIPLAVSRASAVIARWMSSPEFVDVDGRPKILPRNAPGPQPSFESLVASVTRDVRPRAVLDEWLDRKLVSLDSEGRVILNESAFIPAAGSEEQLYYFGRNLHDHIAAAAANVSGEMPPFLERATHYDGLSLKLAQRLSARSRELAVEALRVANQEAQSALADDAGGPFRWTFGVYIYREAERDDDRQEGAK